MGSLYLGSHLMKSCTWMLTHQLGKVNESWLLPLNITKARGPPNPKPTSQNIKNPNQKGSQRNGHLSRSTKSSISLKAPDKATNPSSSTTFQFSARAPSSSTDAPFSLASHKPNNVIGNLDQQSRSGT